MYELEFPGIGRSRNIRKSKIKRRKIAKEACTGGLYTLGYAF